MTGHDDQTEKATAAEYRTVLRQLRWLSVAVIALIMAVGFNTAAVYGTIIEFHAGEGLLIGSASGSGIALGFIFGWFAHRAVR